MVATTGMRSSAMQPDEQVRVDGRDVAHEAQLRVAGLGADQAGVLARHPDGERAVDVDRRDDVPVDLADQDHAGDVEGLGVGHPQSVDELGDLAQPGHQLADLRSSPWTTRGRMPTDRMSTMSVAKDARALPPRVRPFDPGQAGRQGVAAVLDDHHLAPEAPDVREGLDQDRGFLGRPDRADGWVEAPAGGGLGCRHG